MPIKPKNDYKPLHPDNPTAPGSAKSRDYAGYGPTDGIQSEGETAEARKFLEYDGGQTADFNVRTGRTKSTRYTRWHNES